MPVFEGDAGADGLRVLLGPPHWLKQARRPMCVWATLYRGQGLSQGR